MCEIFIPVLVMLIFFIDYARKDNKISNLKNKIDELDILYKEEQHKYNIANKNHIRLTQENNYFNNKIAELKNNKNDNIWKNNYNRLNKKYIQIYDEVVYLRDIYDKEHSKLISLEKELEISHKKVIELQRNNLQRYTKEDIENINDWRKFEQFIATQFKRKNFNVILTPQTNDGGKDIIIEKNDIKTYVECKYWNSNKSIGREEIQKLAGATMMDGLKNALFITTSTYNENALETAKALNKNGFNINLWTIDNLLDFINQAEKNHNYNEKNQITILKKEKEDLISMFDELTSKIHIEPFMEFTIQSKDEIEETSIKYAMAYLGLTQDYVDALEYAEDDDINNLRFKYTVHLIKNILISNLDRKFITDYLTQDKLNENNNDIKENV